MMIQWITKFYMKKIDLKGQKTYLNQIKWIFPSSEFHQNSNEIDFIQTLILFGVLSKFFVLKEKLPSTESYGKKNSHRRVFLP